MASTQQRAALQRQIWAIANDVRGAVDGWDFKQHVLGTLFYRFISENFSSYIEGGDHSADYAVLPDSKENVDHFARSVPLDEVAGNDYNLSVSSYVEAEDTREVIDILELNAELKARVERITQLRAEIDAILAEIEGV